MKKIFTILLPVLPIAATFWLYKPVLTAHFNWEDGMVLGDAIKTLTSGNIKYLFYPWYGGYARLLWQWIAVFNFKFFGYNATPFFVLILSFHLSNILLTYLLAVKITKSKFVAFFSSFLYGVYQINSSSISWISSGIKDIPMTTFFLLSFLFFIRFRERDKKIFLIGSYLTFALSFASEFKAITVPFVFIIYDFLFIYKKSKNIGKELLKFFPFSLIIFFLCSTFYSDVFGMISHQRDWGFWQTFIAGLPLYLLPISRIFWLRVYTDAHGLTAGHSDELFLKEFGWIILASVVVLSLILFFTGQKKKVKIIIFLLMGIVINFSPVMLLVFSQHQTLWAIVTVHFRYFLIVSPLAAILLASVITWINDLFLHLVFKSRIFPFFFICILIYFFINSDQKLLQNYFLNWTYLSKRNFQIIKQAYPVLAKETIFVIEGTDKEGKHPFFQHRYLFDNIFALYSNPNNPNYQNQQKALPFNLTEGSNRSLKRLLYYTNIKDFLVGNHYHLYKEGEDINFITPTLPWNLPAHDRLFLGAVYGFYNPEKIIDFKFLENGTIVNVTEERKNEVENFLRFYCFENGIRKCTPTKKQYDSNPLIKNIMASFSLKGKNIIEFLIRYPNGKIPKIEEIPQNL